MRKLSKVFLFTLIFLAACTTQPAQDGETIYRIGAIHALTGDGAVYGIPVQKVIQQATADLNAEWAAENRRLEVIFEDGRCNGRDSLTAAQKLVNLNGIKVLYSGTCSGETLGAAPFIEESKVLWFSPTSSSPDVTNAGDYVFRNYPSDNAQIDAMLELIAQNGYERVALLSENTDYAQAQRRYLSEAIPEGAAIVADEVINSDERDVRAQVAKIQSGNPDVVIVLPQTIPMAGIFAKQLFESDVSAEKIGNDVQGLPDTLKTYPIEMEGFYVAAAVFEKESSPEFALLQEQTGCDIGYYCATTYDGIFLLGEILEQCGDQDPDCVKERLYATQNWEGPLAGSISFDENGDVAGNFVMMLVENGAWVAP